MKTIAIVNQKGGCGKTTVSINLASALAEAGQRVLLVDMDPQSHCAVGLAVPEEQIEQSIYDVLISRSRNEPIKLTEILWQISDRLELAPASIDLAAFEQQMAGISERESCLIEALNDMKDSYDYAIIDCPPAVGLLTFNALRAATDVIVPVETGYFALHGLSKQLETLSILCRRSDHNVNVRVLASMYDIRTKMAREILADLRSRFGDKMFNTIICFNTKIKEASSFGQPISEYDSASKGRKDFSALAEEILGAQTKLQRNEFVNSLADQLESISASADELLQTAGMSAKPIEPPKVEQPEPAVREEEPVLYEIPAAPVIEEKMEPYEQPEPAVRDDEPVLAEIPILPEHEEKIELLEQQVGEEPPADDVTQAAASEKRTAAKLSEYYGVTQLNDAVAFVTLYPRAHTVQIAGDFNNWQPQQHTMEKVGDSGVWQTQVKLDPGRYRYRLVVDGQWQQDPYNELTELNPFGGFNSIIEIK
jgi:chromosome partitioning protein